LAKAGKASDFSLSCVEESARLLKYQASLEEKRGKVRVPLIAVLWIRITLMRIRILIFYVMRIWIRIPDPDPSSKKGRLIP
jgi:hypothetical protein